MMKSIGEVMNERRHARLRELVLHDLPEGIERDHYLASIDDMNDEDTLDAEQAIVMARR